jgi:hypothetical protein
MPRDLSGYAFYLPDTFAAGSECFPNRLTVYQEFNLEMARDSARNVSARVPWASPLRFLAAAPGAHRRRVTEITARAGRRCSPGSGPARRSG